MSDDTIDVDFVLPADPEARSGRVRIIEADWLTLRDHLLGDGHEHAALLICGLYESVGEVTFLVREVVPLEPEDYLDRGALHLSIAPTTFARVAKRARLKDAAVIVVHSHPFAGQVTASKIDLRTEADLCRRVLPARTGKPAGALVVGPNGIDGRIWTGAGAGPMTSVRIVGDRVQTLHVTSHGVAPPAAGHRVVSPVAQAGGDGSTARQELLWGAEGQELLRRARVVVVGCGGTGSHVATQLAHLRVGTLTLVDHDSVETSNLSRIVGLGPSDVGRSKVEALASRLLRIDPDLTVESIQKSVLDMDPQSPIDADVVVCATDGHGSRSMLTELAAQHYVPVVDLGVEVVPGEQFRAGGGVRVLRPGGGCLWCGQTLSPALVREEYLSEAERSVEYERGYLRGHAAPTPSVVALNGVVASLAVMEVCQLLVGMLGSGRDRLLYRSERRAVSTAELRRRPECHVCGENGVRGLGDASRIKTRWRKVSAPGA